MESKDVDNESSLAAEKALEDGEINEEEDSVIDANIHDKKSATKRKVFLTNDVETIEPVPKQQREYRVSEKSRSGSPNIKSVAMTRPSSGSKRSRSPRRSRSRSFSPTRRRRSFSRSITPRSQRRSQTRSQTPRSRTPR